MTFGVRPASAASWLSVETSAETTALAAVFDMNEQVAGRS